MDDPDDLDPREDDPDSTDADESTVIDHADSDPLTVAEPDVALDQHASAPDVEPAAVPESTLPPPCGLGDRAHELHAFLASIRFAPRRGFTGSTFDATTAQAVQRLQRSLREAGSYEGSIDGQWNDATRDAARGYERMTP